MLLFFFFFFFLGSRSFTPSNFKPSKTQICQDPKPNHNSRSVVANNPTPQNHQTSPRKSNFVTAHPSGADQIKLGKQGQKSKNHPSFRKYFDEESPFLHRHSLRKKKSWEDREEKKRSRRRSLVSMQSGGRLLLLLDADL